jgi:hypothetical protein
LHHRDAEFEALLKDKFAFSMAAAVEARSELEILADIAEPVDVPRVC